MDKFITSSYKTYETSQKFESSLQKLANILAKNNNILSPKKHSLLNQQNLVFQKSKQKNKKYSNIIKQQRMIEVNNKKQQLKKYSLRDDFKQILDKSNYLDVCVQKKQTFQNQHRNDKLKSIIFKKKDIKRSIDNNDIKSNEPDLNQQSNDIIKNKIQSIKQKDESKIEKYSLVDNRKLKKYRLKTYADKNSNILQVNGLNCVYATPFFQQKNQINRKIQRRFKSRTCKSFQEQFTIDIRQNILKQQYNFRTSHYKNNKRQSIQSQHILQKIKQMFEFINLINISFRSQKKQTRFDDLKKYSRKNIKYKYFVGGGNNRQLILQIFKRRWWWQQTNKINQASFIWTQNKLKIQQIDKNIYKQLINQNQDQNNKIIIHKQQQLIKLLRFNSKYAKILTESYDCPQSNYKKIIKNNKQNWKEFYLFQYHNHIEKANILGDKKLLFKLLKLWIIDYKKLSNKELFQFIPETYHIQHIDTQQYKQFNQMLKLNISQLWIIKPGQNSNRGRGIIISKQQKQIKDFIQQRYKNKGTTIIQKYITNLTLYNGRKFDIRAYMLCLIIQGNVKFYWYQYGYIRTSSFQFKLNDLKQMIHLTNDAVQSQNQNYGKYQKGNKLSYQKLQQYLNEQNILKNRKIQNLTTSMKKIAKKISSICYHTIDKKKINSFQLFGLDFLVDANFHPILLEINTNPCLQTSSIQLQKIIPGMLQNVFKISIDSIFSPTMLPDKTRKYLLCDKILQNNKFQLIFDQLRQRDIQWEQFIANNQNLLF